MTALFTKVHTVAVPVADQDRSQKLLEELGFSTTLDVELQPGFRWIEMSLPGGSTTLSLVMTGEQLSTGIDTGIRLVTTDARAAHASLGAKGLDVGDLLDWDSAPLMFSFIDPDGNRFYVSEDG